MPDSIHQAPPAVHAGYQAEHGVPTYTSPRANRYTPYEQSNDIGQAVSSEYKNVDLSDYPVRGSVSDQSIFVMQDKKPSLRQRFPGIFKLIQSLVAFCIIGALLAIPIILTYDAWDSKPTDSKARRDRNLVFYIFVMLEMVWAMTGVAYVIAMVLPYLFRFVAHYVNPAHKRYWRVFIMMRNPIVILLAVCSGWISFALWIATNDNLSIYNNAEGPTPEARAAAQEEFDDTTFTIARILTYFILWAGAYFFEKILVVYLTIHWNFRTNHKDILDSKKLVDALVALYDVSYTMYPMSHTSFYKEDWVIHRGQDSQDGVSNVGRTTVGVVDMVTGSFAQAFGVVFGSATSSHWFAPRSTYAIVGRALQHPASSAALAKRIWMSLAASNSTALTVEDLTEALPPSMQKHAAAFFDALDENENGDIRLDEMIPSIVEAGKKRRDMYMGMANITHVITTLDWLMIGILALLMLVLVLISEVPLLYKLKDTLGLGALGLSFVVGRTLNEFVQGAIFTILDNAWTVGDVIELHNLAESVKSLLIVKQVSLLYTVFEEVGSGKVVQFSNSRSKIKRIANLSRSGKNKEAITLCVDFGTSFKDLELLKAELKEFLAAPENSRDYYPELGLRVSSLCDLARLELRISFRHKSNWSNEALRAARSSRFQCALVAAVRRVPIHKPGGGKAGLGEEGKPSYTVMITDTEASTKRDAEKEKQLKKRMDYVKPDEEPASEVDTSAMTAEEVHAAEEEAQAKKRKLDEKIAKEEQEQAEESQAYLKMLNVAKDGNPRGASTAIDASADKSRPFGFVSGSERGIRVSRRTISGGS